MGCAAQKRPEQTALPPAPAPSVRTVQAPPVQAAETPQPETSEPDTTVKAAPSHILYTETGWASWYGPHYDKRRAANGEIYDMNDMTAAHLTIPLNSIARVTNLKTGDSILVRITDRGPFVNNRIIDLSKAAAEKLNVYRPGTAPVKIDVIESPVPIDSAGRWCVQIGAFKRPSEAAELKEKLLQRYPNAKILQFTSPIGEDWLRVRVAQDDKKLAEQVVQETTAEAGVYLVRLD